MSVDRDVESGLYTLYALFRVHVYNGYSPKPHIRQREEEGEKRERKKADEKPT